MPTIFRSGPYRFFFYSGDQEEPPHVHVERDDSEAKFWLDPIALVRSNGFRSGELNRIRKLVESNHEFLRRSWDEFFQS